MKQLPRYVYSHLGPIPVTTVKGMADTEKGEDAAFGSWNGDVRVVKVDAGTCADNQLYTLFHEMIHLALWDSGVSNFVDDKLAEAVCDSIGCYFAAATKAGYVSLKVPNANI